MPRSCLHACTLPFFRWLMNRTEWFALLFVSLRPPRGFSFSFCLCSALRIAALLLHGHPAAPPARTIRPLHLLRTPLCPSADRPTARLTTVPCGPFLRRRAALDPQPPPLLWPPGIGWRRSPRDRARPPAPRRAALAAAMHSRAMFYVELAFHVATLMALWPLYLSQLAVFRCIPRRKRIDTKVG